MCAFVFSSCHVYCNKMRAYALYGIQPEDRSTDSCIRRQAQENQPIRVLHFLEKKKIKNLD